MKKLLPLLLILILAACSSDDQNKPEVNTKTPAQAQVQQSHPPFQSIPPTTAMQLIGNKPELLIIDVRTTREIMRNGALPNSSHVEISSIAQNGVSYPKDQPLLIVCAVGGRSYAVGKYLEKKGHTEIYNLSGGISRWKKEGMPVVYPN